MVSVFGGSRWGCSSIIKRSFLKEMIELLCQGGIVICGWLLVTPVVGNMLDALLHMLVKYSAIFPLCAALANLMSLFQVVPVTLYCPLSPDLKAALRSFERACTF